MFYAFDMTSSTFGYGEDGTLLFEDYYEHDLVKTHQLPHEIDPSLRDKPVVYLLRDGRDALVSMAHQKKDLVDRGSLFKSNLQEAIIAAEGSYFGGWSTNALSWIQKADVVIRYEDLLTDPMKQAKKVQKALGLPPPLSGEIPDFKSLKSGHAKYMGDYTGISEEKWKKYSEKFFRKGKAGSYREEMPEEMHDLFWSLHGQTMESLGYHKDGSMDSEDDFDKMIRTLSSKLEAEVPKPDRTRVLIEAAKLDDVFNDGVKRYVMGLVKGIQSLPHHIKSGYQIDLYSLGSVRPLVHHDTGPEHVTIKDRAVSFKEKLKTALPQGVYGFFKNVYLKFRFRELIARVLKVYFELILMYSQRKLRKLTVNYDVAHITLPQNLRPFKLVEKPVLLTVHDLTHRTCPQFHTDENIQNAEKGSQLALDMGVDYLAVSRHTKADLMREYGIVSDRIHMAYEGVDYEKFRIEYNKDQVTRVKTKYAIGQGDYFLCLFTLEPRKNLKNTYLAFRDFKEKHPGSEINLVVVGKSGWKSERYGEADPDVFYTGYVRDEDLPMLYSGARAFCYASFYEGFGLPPLEAMHCMTPVIYGNNSSLKELIGENGLPVDPANISDISGKMARIGLDEELRGIMARRAYKTALQFHWPDTARKTLEIYTLLSKRSSWPSQESTTKDKNE